MFWKFNLITTSHVDALLNKDNVTLQELMDEEDILQECKGQTKRLIEFLIRPEIMSELVGLIVKEPEAGTDEKLQYKYPNVACEILTSDVAQINDTLVSTEALMNRLMAYLDTDPPLNPLLASFFSKTMGVLVMRKTEAMFQFCKSRENFVPLLLKHIDTSAIMDLLLKFVTSVDNQELRASIMQWLNGEQVIQRLVGLIDVSCSEDQNGNAAEALCEIVKASREQMCLLQEKAPPDPLLEAVESTEVVADLLNHMFTSGKKESVLVSGISVLLSLLEFRKQGLAGQQQQQQQQALNCDAGGGSQEGGPGGAASLLQGETACFASLFFRSENAEQMTTLDIERLRAGVAKVLAAVGPRLGDFLSLLSSPPEKPSWTTSFGLLDPPLGQTRLEVCHLVNALINSNNDEINGRLAELGTLPAVLDLFFTYSWNNFLHTQVAQIINSVLSSASSLDQEGNKVHPLIDQLFGACAIVQRVLDAWDENNVEQSQPGKHRRGYMGHLTKIINDVVAAAENGNNSEIVQARLKALPAELLSRWEAFTAETLPEVNKKNTSALCGGLPNTSSTEDDECIDLREVGFNQDTALQQVFPRSVQQAFSDYQMQQMTSNFVDQFGFNDDEFVEADENIVGHLDQLARANFQLPSEVNMSNAELFERVCREKAQALDDADSDEDVWEDKEVTFSPAADTQRRLTDDGDERYSSDSDDDGGAQPSAAVATSSDEVKMDVDHGDSPWGGQADAIAMDTTSPWDNAASCPDEGGWASFDNFANFNAANFENVADTTTPSLTVAMETSEQQQQQPVTQTLTPSKICDTTTEFDVPTSSTEVNSAVVSSSVGASKSNSALEAQDGPADSTPTCEAATKQNVEHDDDAQSSEPTTTDLPRANGPAPQQAAESKHVSPNTSGVRLEDEHNPTSVAVELADSPNQVDSNTSVAPSAAAAAVQNGPM
uniref:Putative sap family cell cycle dependent phosphatase-associated protein n=1 Tax=Ornithodoros turicata TaxID=34597 RepID=A0A2R5LKL2_9ACAR